MRNATVALLAVALAVGGIIGSPTAGAQTPVPNPDSSATQPSAPAQPVAPAADPAAPPEPGPEEDAAPDDEAADEVTVQEIPLPPGGSGGRNVVTVRNKHDGRMRVRGRIRLVQAEGTNVQPVNAAFALASCTDCQTFAVALEIVLVPREATIVVPRNHARALNYQCTRCVTVARAMQAVYTVDDPTQVPDDVRGLLRDMEKELKDIGTDKSVTPAQANARVSAVIARFRDLAEGMADQLDETTEPTSPGAAPPAPAPAVLPATQPADPPASGTSTAPFATPTATPFAAAAEEATPVPTPSDAMAPTPVPIATPTG